MYSDCKILFDIEDVTKIPGSETDGFRKFLKETLFISEAKQYLKNLNHRAPFTINLVFTVCTLNVIFLMKYSMAKLVRT